MKLERDKILEELHEIMDANSDLEESDITIVKKKDSLLFIVIVINNIGQPVTGGYCVVVYGDLSFKLWLKNVCVDKKGLDICKDGKVL